MMTWISRWLEHRGAQEGPKAPAPPVPDLRPALAEVTDLVRKSARGQLRLAAKLDEVDAKLESGLAELKVRLAEVTHASESESARSTEPLAGWDEVLDALDTLDHVVESLLDPAQSSLAQGLRSVAARLGRALAQASIERVGVPGEPLDAKLLRVVGTDEHPEWPEGAVTRVVRAAATYDGRVLREGEVFVNQRRSQ